MWVELSGVESHAYRPVKFFIQTMPQAPSVANRTLKLELSVASSGYSPQSHSDGRGICNLPAGATSVEVALSVPFFNSPNVWTLTDLGRRPGAERTVDARSADVWRHGVGQ